ncbi:MAG: TraM recognition domain-containing protein, partial [Pseudomonadota bacterium]
PYYKTQCYNALSSALEDLEKEKSEFTLEKIYEVMKERYENKDTLGIILNIKKIIKSDFGKHLLGGESALTISKVWQQKKCLYVGLSTQGHGETAMAIGKLFVEDLLFNSYSFLRRQYDGDRKINPLSVYFDEFGSLITPQFIELLNKCRGAGIELTMAVQSASDIDQVNTHLTKQIIENSSNLFIFKQRLDESASLFANAVGTILTKKMTHQVVDGEYAGKGSERESQEMLAHANIIKNLRTGQCILLRHDPTKVSLVNIRKSNKFKQRIELNQNTHDGKIKINSRRNLNGIHYRNRPKTPRTLGTIGKMENHRRPGII